MNFPLEIENFITEEECKILLEFSQKTDRWWENNDERWNLRNIYLFQMHDEDGQFFDEEYQNAYWTKVNVWGRVEDWIRSFDGHCQLEAPQFTRWFPGDSIDPPHADNCEPDGTANYSPHRDYGFVIYLNDDFEGGELFYADPNNGIVKPKARSLCAHTAGMENQHGVKILKSGMRYTTVSFGTRNEGWIKENYGSLLHGYR